MPLLISRGKANRNHSAVRLFGRGPSLAVVGGKSGDSGID